MEGLPTLHTEPTRFESRGVLLIAGFCEQYTGVAKAIPIQWHKFLPHMDTIPFRVGRTALGVRFNSTGDSGNFDYLAGVEVSGMPHFPAEVELLKLPEELNYVKIPAQRYAVFSHRKPVAMLANTINVALNGWLPGSGYEIASRECDAPQFLERFGQDFDLCAEMPDVEIWVPIKSRIGDQIDAPCCRPEADEKLGVSDL